MLNLFLPFYVTYVKKKHVLYCPIIMMQYKTNNAFMKTTSFIRAASVTYKLIRRVAEVSIGVFVEPQILLSAGGTLTRRLPREHAPPEIF